MENAKAEKQKHGDTGTLGACTPAKHTGSVAYEQEVHALYARLAQLEESEGEADAQSVGSGTGLGLIGQQGMGCGTRTEVTSIMVDSSSLGTQLGIRDWSFIEWLEEGGVH
ncbi:UNVERIFIED_CONTAM: hypothetical protein K2H54_049488 [Gekko kuhli]